MIVWNLMVSGFILKWYLIRIYCNVYFLVNQKCILLTVTLFIDYCLIWMCLKRAILFYLILVSSIVSFSSRLHFSCQEIYRAIRITREIVHSSIKKISFPPYWIVPPLEHTSPIISPLEFLWFRARAKSVTNTLANFKWTLKQKTPLSYIFYLWYISARSPDNLQKIFYDP